MADVRSLLRNERAQRRINHPQASYTATGTLECNVCHIPVKSDQDSWNKHLKSPQHAMRQERLRVSRSKPVESTTLREISISSKKRKADDEDEDSRKRTRPVIGLPSNVTVASTKVDAKPQIQNTELPTKRNPSALAKKPTTPATTNPTPQIDEAEWAAFERDVATPPPDLSVPSALMSSATITAMPLSAAELASQSREQANQQTREKTEREIEGEKEDAARALEEEFDEMEGLEERVARLRRLREEIRAQRSEMEDRKTISEEAREEGRQGELIEGNVSEDEDDSDDDGEFGGWGSLRR